MDPIGTASSQPIFQAFCRIVGRNLSRGSKVQWPLEFENCLTDFDRVLCLWSLLVQPKEVAKSGAQVLGLHPSVPLCENSRKSDVLAAKFREIGNGFWRSKACMEANKYYNLALFHSLSNVEKALALGNRSCVLYHLGCYEESANDVTAALKLGFPPEKSDRLHIRAGQCFCHLGHFVKASEHFSQALQSVTDPGLRRLAVDGLVKCKAEQNVGLKVAWRCARGDFPASVQSTHASNLTAASPGSTLLLSANTTSGTSVRLYDAGPTKGWTLETTRNVQPGEILLFDLPYASRLKRDCFLTHCYRCYRRCLNLIPCHGCCQVGFCSEECALAAMQPPDSSKSKLGLGYHAYECGGLPCFLLDNYAGWPKQVSAAGPASGDTSVGGADVSHLAAACVSDTPPALLVSAICKTGTHQAFAGSKARSVSPAVFDPRDYLAASWLVANSAHRSMSDLWQRTVAAVFITYCLSVGGYPMDWTSRNLFVAPSPTAKVELPPATWVAACILYHLQAVPCNAHTYAETLLPKSEQGGVSLTASSIRPLASCLYPTLSLVNHSCDPNVLRVSTGAGSCLLLALRPLPAGTELLDCYSAHYALQARAERQADLLSQYCFSCACVACTEDWPTASALMQTPKSLVTLLCPHCGGRLSAEAPGQGPTPASDGCSCEDSVKLRTRTKYASVVEDGLATRMSTVTQLFLSLPLERIDAKLVASSVDWLKTVLGVNAENGLSGLLCRPASAWDLAQELFKLLIVIQTGNWCVEPAGSCAQTE